MGSWFSNFSIRVHKGVTVESVEEYLRTLAAQRRWLPAAAEDADGGFAVLSGPDSGWVTVCSDLISLEDPAVFSELAEPMSRQLGADVLGISCYDSDYLWLNLVNGAEKTDAWIGIGSAAGLGIRRRTGLAAWKIKVTDHASFSKAAKEKYLFAEEFLSRTAENLLLPVNQGVACYEYLTDPAPDLNVRFLYFRLADSGACRELPRLVPDMVSAMPCFLDRPATVWGVNTGGASRGLSVYFLGPYVEHDEITFSDVCFVRQKGHGTVSEPFALEKVRLSDGQWAYCYHDPGFRIPPKVAEDLPAAKQLRKRLEQSIVVRFVPRGDPRKILDITVALVPDKNQEGQTGWNVWHRWGSKEKYIEQIASRWGLRREDFD